MTRVFQIKSILIFSPQEYSLYSRVSSHIKKWIYVQSHQEYHPRRFVVQTHSKKHYHIKKEWPLIKLIFANFNSHHNFLSTFGMYLFFHGKYCYNIHQPFSIFSQFYQKCDGCIITMLAIFLFLINIIHLLPQSEILISAFCRE